MKRFAQKKCDVILFPILLRRFDKGSHFLVSHFLGWGAGRGQGGVGGVVVVGLVVVEVVV